jgi:tricorn protease
VIGVRDGVIVDAGGTLNQFSFASRESTPLMNGLLGGYVLNASRTKLAYAAGGILGVVDLRPGVAVGQGRVDLSDVQVIVNPRDEWKQMYWEVWRYTRDEYYDAGMRGLNWKAIGDQYAKYLPYINHRADLNYVLGLLIGETGTGHSYVTGGDFGAGPRGIPVGNLGADYEVSGKNIRFKRILRGDNYEESRRGPLGEPGINVNEGDYLLEIDGKPVNSSVHPASLMLNKVGKYVTLTVGSTPDGVGSRKVRVRPIASEGNLRYLDFVESNRKKVEQLSGGRIGYMHIPNTAFEGAVELIRGFYSQTDKDAVLVDERWNGGGYIQPWFVDTLARKKRAGIQQRHGDDWEDAVAIEGPKALLINSYAGSGGDFFPWMFRQSKLGPLIGTRTWGGLVGINGGIYLIDGGNVTAPAFAIYDRETGDIIAENTGVDPDIEVDMKPDEWAKGYDAQLAAGVKYLLDQLAKQPAAKPRTKVPEVGPKGKVGGGK